MHYRIQAAIAPVLQWVFERVRCELIELKPHLAASARHQNAPDHNFLFSHAEYFLGRMTPSPSIHRNQALLLGYEFDRHTGR